jgi:glutamine amidotransferase PdxT
MTLPNGLLFSIKFVSGCQVICFQESKIETVDITFLRKLYGRNFDSFGHDVFHKKYALSVELHATKFDISWTLTNIYALVKTMNKLNFSNGFMMFTFLLMKVVS